MPSRSPSPPATAPKPTRTSPGQLSLPHLLSTLTPTLHASTFVFLHFPHPTPPPASLFQQMSFREREGLTIITTLSSAAEQFAALPPHQRVFECRMVTLDVHSSLDAVGFLAVVATRLRERCRVGVNPVSGFFHDHLFVPVGGEVAVMRELRALAAESKAALNEGGGKDEGEE